MTVKVMGHLTHHAILSASQNNVKTSWKRLSKTPTHGEVFKMNA